MSGVQMPDDITAKVHTFFTRYPERSYPKGQILVFANEDPGHIFYLVEGQVRKYDISYRGDEIIVNTFKPSAFFPMSWAINRDKNHYFYKTETSVTLHITPADDALQFLKDNPDVTLDLLARVYRGTEGLLGRMVHLMSGTARSRLLYELIIECRRFGEKQENDTYILTSNEVDLAARSGLSRETVSREIRKLKTKGWAKVDHGHIIVTNFDAIEQSVGTEI
jgi:CRP/FNR family cyclic AMP-dependent transcriptional regulator